MIPLLAKAAAEGLVKPDVLGDNSSACVRVVDQIASCVSRITHKHPLEGIVLQFLALMGWHMHKGRASKDPEVGEPGLEASNQG